MTISMFGEFRADNGLGAANREVFKSLRKHHDVRHSYAASITARTREIFSLVFHCDVLVICWVTFSDRLAVWLAKREKKKIIYLMHGLPSMEKTIDDPKISKAELNRTCRFERFLMENADRVICVSEKFMDTVKQRFPSCAEKTDFIYNAVDLDRCETVCAESSGRVPGSVLSTGGGKRQKNIKFIASALEEDGAGFVLHVAGPEDTEGAAIRRHTHVIWHGIIPHDDLLRLMAETSVYVQNSTFESFGISVIEALFCGCSTLISENTGCLSLFSTLREEDIIRNTEDTEEIGRKIRYLTEHPNNARLKEGFAREFVGAAWQAAKLEEILKGMET